LNGDQLALVMSGGGARAAYQVGLLRWLGRRYPDLRVPIMTGVSAGAINAAYLASRPHDFRSCVENLADLWSRLTAEEVFRVDSASLTRNVLRMGLKLVSGGAIIAHRAQAAVDTKPLRGLLERMLDARGDEIPGIDANLKRGTLRAIAITASSYTTGQSICWTQGSGIPQWERAHRKSIDTRLGVSHVMASAALPIFFPAIEIDKQWFGDGGIRLTAPLSPAVHLGADRILAISTRYARTRREADQPAVDGYPPPAQIIGVQFNAIFLDVSAGDSQRLPDDQAHRAAAVARPGKARQRIRSGPPRAVPLPDAGLRDARDAVERLALPLDVPARLSDASDRARRGGRGGAAGGHRAPSRTRSATLTAAGRAAIFRSGGHARFGVVIGSKKGSGTRAGGGSEPG
jgi:NTE family protein